MRNGKCSPVDCVGATDAGRITGIRTNGTPMRDTALFDMDMWIRCQQTSDGKSRTNNFAKAAYRRIQVEFVVSNPTDGKMMDGSREVQRNLDLQ